MTQPQDFNFDFNADFGRPLKIVFPNTLRYNEVLKINLMSVVDWVPIADGVDHDIGCLFRVGRGDILLAYCESCYDNADDFIHNRYLSGNIFITTKKQVIFIKAVNPNFPATLNGEITYNIEPTPIPQPLPAAPGVIKGLPQTL